MLEPQTTQCIDCDATITLHSRRAVRTKRCKPCARIIATKRATLRYRQIRRSGLCNCGQPREDGFMSCRKCRQSGQQREAKDRQDRQSRNQCVECPNILPLNSYRRTCDECAQYHSDRSKRYLAERKELVFSVYGKSCKCCDEDNGMLLTIDHVNGDGAEHRRAIGSSNLSLYIFLIKNNFPNGFQTLCYNCNIGRYKNGGTCPHRLIVRECQ